jgi:hypothetical protein
MPEHKPLTLEAIRTFRRQVDELFDSLEKLQREATQRAPTRRASVKQPPSAVRSRRSEPRALDPSRVLEVLPPLTRPGLSVHEIAAKLREKNERVRYALRKLRDDKLARMSGTTSSARWNKLK